MSDKFNEHVENHIRKKISENNDKKLLWMKKMSKPSNLKKTVITNSLKLAFGGMASTLGVMSGILVATLGSSSILHIISNLGCSLVGFCYVYSGFVGMIKLADEVESGIYKATS